MSTITYCDTPECSNDNMNDDMGFYNLSRDEITEFDIYDFKLDYYDYGADICKECLAQVMEDSPNETVKANIEQIIEDME